MKDEWWLEEEKETKLSKNLAEDVCDRAAGEV